MKEVITLERPTKETLAAPVIQHGFEMRFVGKPGTGRTNLFPTLLAAPSGHAVLVTSLSDPPRLVPDWHELALAHEWSCYASYDLPDEAAFAVPPLRRAAQWLSACFKRHGRNDEVVVLGNNPSAQPGLVLGYRKEAK